MNALLQRLLRFLPNDRHRFRFAILLCLAAGFVAFVWDQKMMNQSASAESLKPQAESVESAATYIPAGFVLVPIEVANFESLDAILGKFGVVDLFVGSDNPRVKPRRIASHVKILRAPLNPNHFAVLVPDSESQNIVAYSGALTVVVQNPSKSGPALEKPTESTRPKIKPSRVIVEVPNVG